MTITPFSLATALTMLAMASALPGPTQNLAVNQVRARRGEVSDQGVEVLTTKDLSGSEDEWDEYLEISSGSSSFFRVEFDFDLQATAGIYPQAIRSIEIDTNTIGLDHDQQERTWEIRNFNTKKWEFLGENSNAPSWMWHGENFIITRDEGFANYFNSINRLKVRIRSNNDWDVVNIDYLDVLVTGSADVVTSAPVPDPTPLPTTKPTPSPTLSPTPMPTTKKPTASPTVKPTPDPVTSAPVPDPTPLPTTKPTPSPTLSPTPMPTTKKPTASPTVKPTPNPTTKPATPSPTPKPTTVQPTASPVNPTPPPQDSGGLWKPKASAGLTWQWQLTGSIDSSLDVDMYDVDLFGTPASTIQALKNDGRFVV
jgi:hypothetical protein